MKLKQQTAMPPYAVGQQSCSQLLTVPESAAFLRLKSSTIRAWLLERRLTYVKVGGRVFIRRNDLQAIIDEGVVLARSGQQMRSASVDTVQSHHETGEKED